MEISSNFETDNVSWILPFIFNFCKIYSNSLLSLLFRSHIFLKIWPSGLFYCYFFLIKKYMYMIQNRLGWPSPNIAKSNMTFTSLIINIEFSTGCILLNHLEWSLSWANPWTEGYQVRSDGSEPGDFEHIVTGGGRCVYSHKHQGST